MLWRKNDNLHKTVNTKAIITLKSETRKKHRYVERHGNEAFPLRYPKDDAEQKFSGTDKFERKVLYYLLNKL